MRRKGRGDVRIETERLLIRNFRTDDAAALQEILGDAETMRFLEPPYSPEQTTRFLEEFCIGRRGAVAAEEKSDGRLVGYLLLKALEADVYEMGWIFRRDRWRRGLAREACAAVIDAAFGSMGAHKIVAETIDAGRSVRLMQRLGMRSEGVQRSHTRDPEGEWADLYLYGLLREDWQRRT